VEHIKPSVDPRTEIFMAQLRDHGNIEIMFDILPDIYFYIKDKNYQFMLCNEATSRLFNLKEKADVIGKTEYEFFPKKVADAIRFEDYKIIHHGESIINLTELIVNEFGHFIWVSTNKLPVYGHSGDVLGVMGTTRVLRESETLPEDYQPFAKAIDFIQNNYHEVIDVTALADMCFLSNSQFRRRFRTVFNLPPQQFILKVRVQAACHLLSTTDKTLTDIALKCGFCDQSYFTRQFRSFLDISPKKYRQRWHH
jgi:AraC-like DNA-binding protein